MLILNHFGESQLWPALRRVGVSKIEGHARVFVRFRGGPPATLAFSLGFVSDRVSRSRFRSVSSRTGRHARVFARVRARVRATLAFSLGLGADRPPRSRFRSGSCWSGPRARVFVWSRSDRPPRSHFRSVYATAEARKISHTDQGTF